MLERRQFNGRSIALRRPRCLDASRPVSVFIACLCCLAFLDPTVANAQQLANLLESKCLDCGVDLWQIPVRHIRGFPCSEEAPSAPVMQPGESVDSWVRRSKNWNARWDEWYRRQRARELAEARAREAAFRREQEARQAELVRQEAERAARRQAEDEQRLREQQGWSDRAWRLLHQPYGSPYVEDRDSDLTDDWQENANKVHAAQPVLKSMASSAAGLPRIQPPPQNLSDAAKGGVIQHLGSPTRAYGGVDPTGEALKHIEQVAPPIASSGVRAVMNLNARLDEFMGSVPGGSSSPRPSTGGSTSGASDDATFAATYAAKLNAWVPAPKPSASLGPSSTVTDEPRSSTQVPKTTWGNFGLFDPRGPTKDKPLQGLLREVRPK